jgi:hypothetical protein
MRGVGIEADPDALMLNELERLLKRFEEDEIEEAQFAKISLESPVLFLLAQHRSFRICQRKFFYPEQDCQSNRPITSLGRLTSERETSHGASKGG